MVADTAASFQVRFAAEAEDSAGGGELLWDDMNIVVLPVSKLAANVKVSRVPCFPPFECTVEMGTGCGATSSVAECGMNTERVAVRQQARDFDACMPPTGTRWGGSYLPSHWLAGC